MGVRVGVGGGAAVTVAVAIICGTHLKLLHCSLHCALAAAQCIVISPVCGFVFVWVCYRDDNSKLCASIFTKLGL